MRHGRSQRGVVLMQVMIMSIILSTIAVMLLQWQFGRYILANRVEANIRGRNIVQAAFVKSVSQWAQSGAILPTGGTVSVYDPVAAKNINVVVSVSGSAPNYRVTFSVDSMQYEQ